MWHMTEEAFAAHQRSVAKARVIRREENETEKKVDARARKAVARTPRVRKYRNKPTETQGLKFASKREAKRYEELRLEEQAGAITDLVCQKRYPIVVNGEKVCAYVGDFEYRRDGKLVCEDAKGMKTRVYILKARLMRIVNGIEIVEV